MKKEKDVDAESIPDVAEVHTTRIIHRKHIFSINIVTRSPRYGVHLERRVLFNVSIRKKPKLRHMK